MNKKEVEEAFEKWLKENNDADIRDAFWGGFKVALEQIESEESDKFTMMFGYDSPSSRINDF